MIRLAAAACAAGIVGATSCAPLPADHRGGDSLDARVDAILLRRGLGHDALGVIDNTIRHEAPPPPAAPPLVRDLLRQPLRATQAAALFDRAVPAALRRLVDEALAQPSRAPEQATRVELRELLDPYLEQLAQAQRLLRAASSGAQLDPAPAMAELRDDLPSAATLQALAARIDRAVLEQATQVFVEATARFIA